MSWTDLQTVRLHLLGSPMPSHRIYQVPIYLSGADWFYLPYRAANPQNATVYSENAVIPFSASVVLNGTSWSVFDGSKIAYGSVSVADDVRIDTIFTEGLDYVVDYEQGRIKRMNGSAIPDGASVLLIYSHAQVFSSETDYEWSNDGGALRRRANSKIGDPSFLLIDYEIAEENVEDTLIQESIAVAEKMIVSRLSEPYTTETDDPMLKHGATLLSVGLVALTLASRPLQYGKDPNADERSKQWMNFYDRCLLEAWKLLKPFLKVAEKRSARITNGV